VNWNELLLLLDFVRNLVKSDFYMCKSDIFMCKSDNLCAKVTFLVNFVRNVMRK